MIKINCETRDVLKLTDLVSFQGNLKKRTDSDIDELKKSLLAEGLMMPFAVWVNDGKNLLLDGHGRKEALIKLAIDDADILNADWPVIYVKANSEEDARKALLQITSSYGKITKSGYKQFCVSIPDYKAPSISKFNTKPLQRKINVNKCADVDYVILKIKVSKDKLDSVKEIFRNFDFIKVM